MISRDLYPICQLTRVGARRCRRETVKSPETFRCWTFLRLLAWLSYGRSCHQGNTPSNLEKEVNDLFKYFLKPHSVALTLIKLQAGGFICHSLAHPHVTQSFPELIDLGRYHFVRLFNINQMRNRHPTSSAGNPEYF